jgi:hypothetical protein
MYTLLAYYRKGGILKEDGIFRVREIVWEEKHGGRCYVCVRKEDI